MSWASYFGDAPVATDCGHCGWCLGERGDSLPSTSSRDLEAAPDAVWTDPESPAPPNRSATSPLPVRHRPTAASRLKLSKHPNFGALGDVPFSVVMRKLQTLKKADESHV